MLMCFIKRIRNPRVDRVQSSVTQRAETEARIAQGNRSLLWRRRPHTRVYEEVLAAAQNQVSYMLYVIYALRHLGYVGLRNCGLTLTWTVRAGEISVEDNLDSWCSHIPAALIEALQSDVPPTFFLGSGFGKEALPPLATGAELAEDLRNELGVHDDSIAL